MIESIQNSIVYPSSSGASSSSGVNNTAQTMDTTKSQDAFFNILKSQDKDGTVFELFITNNGNIESGNVNKHNLVNVFQNEQPFVKGGLSDNIPAGIRNAFKPTTTTIA